MPPGRLALLTISCILALGSAAVPAAGKTDGSIEFVYVVPISHLDIGFTGTPQEVAALQKQYLDEAMDDAEQDPRFRWTIENVYQYDQWAARTHDPAQLARLRSLIAAGRFELAAGYLNSHEGQWGAEEANRFLYPGLAAAAELETTLHTAIVDDVPGSSSALPQVLAGNGVQNLVAGINTAFGGEPDIPMADSLFMWRGVEGSEVLTWISQRSYAEGVFDWCLGCAYADMERLTQRRIDEYEQAGYPYDSIIAMDGFDNDGPDLIMGALDNIDRWNSEHTSPKLIVSPPTPFFDHVRALYGNGFATYSGDWSGRWETNDAYTPITTGLVRRAKSAAPAAETLGSLNRLYGIDPEPAALDAFDRLYRGQLEFDEHSGAGGSGELTEDQVKDSDRWWVRLGAGTAAGARTLLSTSARTLAGGVRTDRQVMAVLNPLSWPRTDLVRVPMMGLPAGWLGAGAPVLVDMSTGASVPTQLADEGRTLLFRADDVPSLGYKLYAPAAVAGTSPRRADGSAPIIENEFYRLELDPLTGSVTSVYDKAHGRELVDPGTDYAFGEAISAFQNGAFVWGIYQHVVPAAVRVSVKRGPVATALTVRRRGSPHVRTQWWLYDGIPRIDTVNTFDRSQMPFVPRERNTKWYFLTYPLNVGHPFEGHFQSPNAFQVPQRDWIPGTRHGARVSRTATDVRGSDGFGVTVANRETYLSAFGGLGFWNEADPAAPILFPVPVAKTDEVLTTDHGWVRFPSLEPGLPTVYTSRLSFSSSEGGFDPVAAGRVGAGFASDLLSAVVAPNPDGPLPGPSGTLLAFDQPNVVLTTMKGAEDGSGDVVLRVQEVAGRAASGVRLATSVAFSAAEVDGLGEQREGAVPLPVDPVTFDIGPFQTLTIRLTPVAP